jgi:hypothetical protein
MRNCEKLKEQIAGQNLALIDVLQLVVFELEKADARQAGAIRRVTWLERNADRPL